MSQEQTWWQFAQITLLNTQIPHLEKWLHERLIGTEGKQRLLWVPAFGRVTTSSVFLEIDDIARFGTEKHLFLCARVMPGVDNSKRTRRHKSGNKDGNKYVKTALADAAVHVIRYYPEVRRSTQAIALTLVAKELARIVYDVLKDEIELPFAHVRRVMRNVKRCQANTNQAT